MCIFYDYMCIYEYISNGTFGTVYKGCNPYYSSDLLAIKVSKNNENSKHELKMLRFISNYTNKFHIEYKHMINLCFMEYYFADNISCNFVFKYYKYNLFSLIQKNKLNKNDIKNICFQIAAGLQYIHYMNIVHCDLKPENILCEYNELNNIIVKIADFGSSYFINKKVNYEIVTKYYRSPEIFCNLQDKTIITIKPCIDMWSFGIIIYILINSDFPFKKFDNKMYKYIYEHPIKKLYDLSSIMDRLLQLEINRYDSNKIYMELQKIL
ncbi:ser/thr kinase (Cop-B1R) [Mythimna separata entomopoxvirus 'L']|uniref:Ser/thr kinase (Cop-B1R) n=1 Tax=Mythimna separata entomopoxvirus 'L' TaxID=1293572 RepID=A0A916P1S1_9POXV|nr:ser/thr kinase (Cop-B1R) [Mythimna separata entomopoxvirus 'L']CCU56305.1 ser/thr kinase (Cop-B1R) [Mythimna separata entomopoxvirus 'L']